MLFFLNGLSFFVVPMFVFSLWTQKGDRGGPTAAPGNLPAVARGEEGEQRRYQTTNSLLLERNKRHYEQVRTVPSGAVHEGELPHRALADWPRS